MDKKADSPLDFRAENLTVDDTIWLLTWLEKSNEFTKDDLVKLRGVIASASSWTEAEVGRLSLSQMMAQLSNMKAGGDKTTVPFESASDSNSGEAEPHKQSQDGAIS